ncbi:flavodoxin family protein [Clostridium perfringens]|uniref:flavodoxin family protein n=1 Tax=Clostridium perfringens TaxID=1502 RepID=UPI0013A67291|nr:flavodoxin family protein [Clostridium perfringens]
MNVFVYIGSPRGEESMSYKFIKEVEKASKELDSSINFDIFRADKVDIKESDGSSLDFINGQTLFNDDMQIIEESLLKSDFVIMVSPVYAHSISSQTKKLIDRLSYWLHIFRLVGKNGFVISTSCNNGNELVNAYLTEIMQYLGLYVTGELSLETSKINDDNIFQSYVRFLAKKIIMSKSISELDIPSTQEKMFQHQKDLQYNSVKLDSKERRFWEENGYFNYDSFEDLFKSKMKIESMSI